MSPDDVVVRAAQSRRGGVARAGRGCAVETPGLYLAANGCDVTALAEPDDVQRVLDAAEEAGLGERVHASAAGSDSWTPDAPLTAVIYTPAAFAGLGAAERARVIQVLQSATADGGVHLVQTIAAGKRTPVSLDELRRRYRGWDVTVEEAAPSTFMARKGAVLISVFRERHICDGSRRVMRTRSQCRRARRFNRKSRRTTTYRIRLLASGCLGVGVPDRSGGASPQRAII